VETVSGWKRCQVETVETVSGTVSGLTPFSFCKRCLTPFSHPWQWPRIEAWLRARRLPLLNQYTLQPGEWTREFETAIVRSWPSHAPVLLLAMSAAAAFAVLALAAYVLCREE